MKNARVIRNKFHDMRIIEIKAPIRFYWTKDGKYDGMEIGELNHPTRYELELIREVIVSQFRLLNG